MKKINLFAFLLLSTISQQTFATSFSQSEYTCSACQTKDTYSVLASTNQLEPSSLDGRPGEMARFAILGTLTQCKHCGLVSYDISKEICPKQNEIVKSETYKDKLTLNSINEWSKKYQAYAYLLEECGKPEAEIANAYLKAAWAADDKNEDQNAIEFRKKAISYLEKTDSIDNKIQLIDLYRRTSQFEKALKLINTITVDPTLENACTYNGLIEHQKELIDEKNKSDQRMLYVLYCPPSEDNLGNAIESYMDLIITLQKQNDSKKVEKIQYKVIALLVSRETFLDQFVLTYLYYKTNQIEKAKETERRLKYPQKWDGFFNKRYGNWILSDIDKDIKNNTLTKGTYFYELANKMVAVRNKSENIESDIKTEEINNLARKIKNRADYTIDNIPYSEDLFEANEQGITLEEYLSKIKLPFGATMRKETDTSCEIFFSQDANSNLTEEEIKLGITFEDIKKEIQKSKNVDLTCDSDNKCLYEKVEEYRDGLI